MRTRAAVAVAAGQPLQIMDLCLDGSRAAGALVAIRASGLCHTDAHTLSGGNPDGLFPAVQGDEGAGMATEIGPMIPQNLMLDEMIKGFDPWWAGGCMPAVVVC